MEKTTMVFDEDYLTPQKPDVNQKDILDLLRFHYDFSHVTHIEEIVSYRDRNFFFKVSNDREGVWRHGYIMKIIKSKGLKPPNPELLDGMHKMMEHLNETVVSTPIPIPDINGCKMVSLQLPILYDAGTGDDTIDKAKKGDFMVTIFSYIPGKVLDEVLRTEELYFHSGKMAAKVANSLRNFSNKAIEDCNNIWTLTNISHMRDLLHAVDDDEKRSVYVDVIESFESFVGNKLDDLPVGINHGDMNHRNILVSKEKRSEEYKWCGLLDYGEVNKACVIYDFAVLIGYLMAHSDGMDPIEIGGHCLAGYVQERMITHKELNVIMYCALGRIVESQIMGQYSFKKNPQNKYILTSAQPGWLLLQKFSKIPKEEIVDKWIEIINQYNTKDLPSYLQLK